MKYLSLLAVFMSQIANATLHIAVIDTGLDLTDSRLKSHLCASGHKDFTGTGIKDTNGHGTHVVGLIEQYAENSDYCLYIIKYYNDKVSGPNNTVSYLAAIKYVLKNLPTDLINYSGGGIGPNTEEYLWLSNYSKVIFIVSAGNNSIKLTKQLATSYYPASYFLSNILVVGSKNKLGHVSDFSNYSENIKYEYGENVTSTWIDNSRKVLSGTSMAAAIFTGKYIAQLSNF
jgi:subtilisin family serine protease